MASDRAVDIAFDTAQRILSVTPSRQQALEHVEQLVAGGGKRDFWVRVRDYLQVLPSSSSRLNGQIDDRKCSLCGRVITGAEWKTLPLLGFQVIPTYQDEPGEVLELKNDTCGSTLARMAPFSPEALERGVEVELRNVVDLKFARQLAADRLEDDPLYYDKPS